MELRSGKRKLDAYQPTFDPNLDIATVVFSHVQCVGTRVRLAQVSKLWRDASKLAAASEAQAKRDADAASLRRLRALTSTAGCPAMLEAIDGRLQSLAAAGDRTGANSPS